MLKSKENNKIDGYLFTNYSKKKLRCLSQTYEELAQMYRDIPQEDNGSDSRKDRLYRKQLNVSVPVEHKRRALIQYLKKRGIVVRELMFLEGGSVAGIGDSVQNRISIEARLSGKYAMSVMELSGLLSEFFGRRLIPSLDGAKQLTRCYDTFLFEDEPRFVIISAISRAVKENEKISGDNFSVEEYNPNQVIMMVADGMGSGEQANKDSQSVIEFMEKFLEAGFQKEKAFSMVNGAIASQSQCCNLTTLDLCAMNLLTGDAEFIKAGAAASYLKRGGKVEEIVSDTLPLGSIEELCPMTQTIKLADSDMLVMLSDGVSDAFENISSKRLAEVIAAYHTVNPKELSDYLLQYAISCQGGHIVDDMTILVCSVFKNL